MPCQPKETFNSTLPFEPKTMAEHSTSTRAMTTTVNEVDLYNQLIYNYTESVMKQRVHKLTREIYKRSNITFILWLFYQHKKYPSLMQPTLYDMIKTKNLENIYWMPTRCKWSKSRHVIRSVCLKALRTINPYAQASMLVKLENLTFTIFSRFLRTFKKKVEEGVNKSKEQVTTRLLRLG